jgi:arylsulfatase A-like enzyme
MGERAGRRQPNVVVVLTDDMGWGDLGCYGAEKIPTPAMDRVAREGVRATDCHSASALCTPSRYALLTGRYAWRGPLKKWVTPGHGPAIIERDRPTVASILARAGYATGAFGKWHLGLDWCFRDGRVVDPFAPGSSFHQDLEANSWQVDYSRPFGGGPLELGFERFFGIAGSLDMPPYCFLSQDRTVGIPSMEKEVYHPQQRWGLQVPDWDERRVDERFVSEACEWLGEAVSTDRPFFCYLALSAPHRPCLPPEFVAGRSAAGPRGDMVCVVDWAVGQVLDTLDALGVSEDTLLILTSDNGAPLADADGETYGHLANGDWRGQKADIWEGGHREPFLARWPGRIPADSSADGLMCLSDLMATVAAATGVVVPEGAGQDSVNVLGMLRGAQGPSRRQTVVHHSGDGMFSYRSGHWKVIFGSGSGGFSEPKGQLCDIRFPQGQLYDLASDPREECNLWDEQPQVVEELYGELKQVVRTTASGLSFDIRLSPAGPWAARSSPARPGSARASAQR